MNAARSQVFESKDFEAIDKLFAWPKVKAIVPC